MSSPHGTAPPSDTNAISRRRTLSEIQEWRKKEEKLWWQRAHSDDLKYGDTNTRCFHSRANMRRAKNMILGLLDDHGILHTSHEDITGIVTSYYTNLFTSSQPSNFDDVSACIPTRVTADLNDSLCRPYTREEVDCALKQMHPHKALGLDGMNPFFNQKL